MRRYLLWLAVLYTCVITWLSLAKVLIPVDIKVEGSDKIGHFLAYFVFAIVWFLFFFFSRKQSMSFSKSLLISAVFAFLFGLLMEFCQDTLTSYRNSDWNDVLANTSGIVLAVIVMIMLKNKLVSFRIKVS
ncbi:Predicted lipoprotein [Aquimarina amphilecti]|uniref:Predicted lipoprotein n=1 Tax=Aquimarina amphilecti TaxID=1038014 RepID=A0A1H7N9B7_AQUAM|nr:VanZ family protein [Aquimarina amphilecti]SEL19859.1 Predicted lipoprotein [Aquimarina amphilecti]